MKRIGLALLMAMTGCAHPPRTSSEFLATNPDYIEAITIEPLSTLVTRTEDQMKACWGIPSQGIGTEIRAEQSGEVKTLSVQRSFGSLQAIVLFVRFEPSTTGSKVGIYYRNAYMMRKWGESVKDWVEKGNSSCGNYSVVSDRL